MFDQIAPQPSLPDSLASVLSPEMRQRAPKNQVENLPNNLRKLRLARRMSLAEVGALIGMTGENVRKRETGERQLKAHEIERFARIFECEPMAIIGEGSELSARERAIVDLFRALPAHQQDAIYRLASSLAEPTAELTAGVKRTVS